MQAFRSLLELLFMLATDVRIVVLFALLSIAAVTDCRSYRIPNWLTMGGALCGLAYGALAGAWSGLGLAVAGLLVGFLTLVPFYVLGVMGAGDVKLMAMVGAFLGIPGIAYAVLSTFIVGGVLALAVIVGRGLLSRTLGNVKVLVQTMSLSVLGGIRPDMRLEAHRSVGKLPYGVSIALGAMGYVVAHQIGYL